MAGREGEAIITHDANVKKKDRARRSIWVVPEVGLEPTRLFRTMDFESIAATNYATQACLTYLASCVFGSSVVQDACWGFLA